MEFSVSFFTALSVYIITMAITPGPNCILSMVNAAQKGFPKCLTLNLGMLAGLLILDTFAYCVVSLIVSYMPIVKPVLQVAGIIYILYLAWSIYKRGEIKVSEKGGDFRTGFILQFMNVKAILLGTSVVSNYILPANLTLFGGYLIIVYLVVMCFVCGVVWALGGAVFAKSYNAHRRVFNLFFSLILIILAVSNCISMIKAYI